MNKLKYQFFSIFVLFALYCSEIQAQNPFEIRRTKVDTSNVNASSTDTVKRVIVNPFELKPAVQTIGIQSESLAADLLKQKIKEWSGHPTSMLEIKSALFWLMLLLTFLLAIALNLNRAIILKLYKSSFNLNHLSLLYRESKEENRIIFPLLYGLYFIGLSLFVYLTLVNFYKPIHIINLLYVSMGTSIIYLIRHISLKIFGFVFKIDREIDRYLFSIVAFGCLMSIILIPADFLIAFTDHEWAKKIIYTLGIFLVIAYVFRQLKEILISSNLWRESIFHFLLYLCTFEIAPFMLLWTFLGRLS
ncbi:MAG: DUF4271 domain-containing protein [Saprospiraceae bacterium]|nr:DUF4271 domain-containing protein [Saprospiraceae bacterium]